MRCDDGGCVLLRRKCDNIFDCLDGSDERGCGKGFTPRLPDPFLFFSFFFVLYFLTNFNGAIKKTQLIEHTCN